MQNLLNEFENDLLDRAGNLAFFAAQIIRLSPMLLAGLNRNLFRGCLFNLWKR
jgi:hypothetical protein